jgi:hypothetical protein
LLKAIVITSIFPPTKAVKLYSKFRDWMIIVVGDKKTPSDWKNENIIYLSPKKQKALGYKIGSVLPWNHYSRKIMGYIYAIQSGAEIIVDTDDDNIPLQKWNIPDFSGRYLTTPENAGFVNIYGYFTHQKIWPRGFPLSKINDRKGRINKPTVTSKTIRVGIWQGLADGDPDVDAIYRLVDNQPCYFFKKKPLVLRKGTICPFNSQNTIFTKELFPLLYLPAYVSFRFTDILRGLVAQPIMWAANYHLGFFSPTVLQERNPHNYIKDFELEIPCYLYVEDVIECVANIVKNRSSIKENLYRAYDALLKKKMILNREMVVLDQWLAVTP